MVDECLLWRMLSFFYLIGFFVGFFVLFGLIS